MKTRKVRVGRFVNMLVVVDDFYTPRYFQHSSICCEVLFYAKSHLLESGARYSCAH